MPRLISISVSLLSACSLFLCHAAPDPRPVRDPRVREFILPKRVVWQSPADACLVRDAQVLLENFSGQITLESGPTCVLRNSGKPPGVLLDFGRELHGGLQIAVADLKPASNESKTVRVRVR